MDRLEGAPRLKINDLRRKKSWTQGRIRQVGLNRYAFFASQ